MKKTIKKNAIKLTRPLILSRHPSHNILRRSFKKLPLFNKRVVIRFGSTTEVDKDYIEINTTDAIKNSSNKLLMKFCFKRANVKTAFWWESKDIASINEDGVMLNTEQTPTISFPIVAKAKYGSKGKGNTLIKNLEEYNNWLVGKQMNRYIFEKFMNYGLEYRLHITEDGCFYTCRKALKKDCPEDQKWRHHDDNCVWFLEENENFFKPNSWDDIINDCVKALKEIGADVLSFDVKVQSGQNNKGKKREYQDFILLECNSASSMGDYNGETSKCASAYINQLPKIIIKKLK